MSKKSEPTDGRIDNDENAGDETDRRQSGHDHTGREVDASLTSGFSRRGALAALTGLGVLGLGSGTASAATTLEFDNAYSGATSNNFALKLTNATTGASTTQNGIEAYADADGGRGLFGRATSDTGSSLGVYGLTDSDDDNAAGVKGKATTTSSAEVFGVRGTTDASSGRGVEGQAYSNTGSTIGVKGRTVSGDDFANGVYGVASDNGTGTTIGVKGVSDSEDGIGVLAKASNSDSSCNPVGLRGTVVDSTGTAIEAKNSGGKALEATGNANVTGDLSVDSELSVEHIGGEAHRDKNQDITVDNSYELVEFDNATTDDTIGLSQNGVFDIKSDGTYLVTTQITWSASNISQEDTSLRIILGSNVEAEKSTVVAANNEEHSISLSKTLRGATATQSISVKVKKDDGATWTILKDNVKTWIEITKIA